MRDEVLKAYFVKAGTDLVVRSYRDNVKRVHRHPRYFESVKAKFATRADGWLVAHA